MNIRLICVTFSLLVVFLSLGEGNKKVETKLQLQNAILTRNEDQILQRDARETSRKNKDKTRRKAKKSKPKKKGKHKKNKKRSNVRKSKQKFKKSTNNKTRKNKSLRRKKIRKIRKLKKFQRKMGQKANKCGRQNTTNALDETCLSNLVNSISFERDQVTNFVAQYNRIKNFVKLVGNKAAKKGDFSNSTSTLLEALGGNGSNPACAGQRMTRGSRNAAVDSYKKLSNCSSTIETSCQIPNDTYSPPALDTCNTTYQEIKAKNKECTTKTTQQDNACACWAQAIQLVTKAKNSTCDGKKPSDAMRKLKVACISTFSGCKKAEDASIGYIVTCRTCNSSAGECDLTTPAEAAANVTTVAAAVTTAAATAGGGATTATNAATTAAATAATAVTGSCAVKCGVKKQGTKIVGGAEAAVNEYPWIAFLSTGCGGSIVADKWIVTAAHCFFDKTGLVQEYTNANVADITIDIGEHDRMSTTESTITKAIKPNLLIVHPKYEYKTVINDIALLRVPAMDLKVYTPVCLPTAGKNYDGKKAWVYGWGALKFQGESPSKLQELELTIVSDAAAKTAYSTNVSPLTDAQLAVMVFAGGVAGKDACSGDSGGPFSYGNPDNNGQHELVGVVSWGEACGGTLPGAYAEVSAFRTWIDEEIKKNGGATFTC